MQRMGQLYRRYSTVSVPELAWLSLTQDKESYKQVVDIITFRVAQINLKPEPDFIQMF
jgi:hypothetical protein